MPFKKQVFFFLLFFLDFRVFVYFLWLQEFHESLINFLLPLTGCFVDNIFSHLGIGGEFCHFSFSFYDFFFNCFYFVGGSS